jgi:molybdate transport system ATP-binding protein
MSLLFDLQMPRRDFELNLQGEFGNETIGIFGPSGAGKTSFFSLLTGLERPRSGRIELMGRVLTDTAKNIFVPVHKRRIGVVFQEKLLFPHMTIRENMLFGEGYAREKRIHLDEVTDLLGLNKLLDSMPWEASGGEQQRAAIGRALLTSPDLLLLDEPFNAVDNSLRATILPYLKNLRDQLHVPFLVISHDLPDIQRLTDQIYLIDQGRCAGFGNVLDYYGDNDSVTRDSGLVNTFRLTREVSLTAGLYSCSVEGIPTLKLKVPRAPQETFSLVVHPSEIALSCGYIPNISIQNQVPGRISRLILTEDHVLCLVDVGIRIAVKISLHAVQELDLKVGDDVFCLIKALAFRS